MHGYSWSVTARRLFLAALLAVAIPPPLLAQRLAVSTYGVEEGLPSNYVTIIRKDSRGFLWFATRDGLGRFDGDRFVTYTLEDGLPHPIINDVIESRSGHYWIATNGEGVCRLDPATAATSSRDPTATARNGRVPAFITTFRLGSDPVSNRVNALYEDRKGRIWAGADKGVFRLDPRSAGAASFTQVSLTRPGIPDPQDGFEYFAETSAGDMWMASSKTLYKIAHDDVPASYSALLPRDLQDQVLALSVDAKDRLWIGHRRGLAVMEGASLRWITPDGFPRGPIRVIRHRRDGRMWLLMNDALVDYGDDWFRTYSAATGELPGNTGDYSRLFDDERELWIGTGASGALRINLEGFTHWEDSSEGSLAHVQAMFEQDGVLTVVSGTWQISRFENGRFRTQGRLPVPAGLANIWGSESVHLDPETGWWALSNGGLWLFGHDRTPRRFGANEGVADPGMRMFRDSRGRLWIGMRGVHGAGLSWWDSRVRRFVRDSNSLPPGYAPSVFAEDRNGQLWIGFYDGNLARGKNGQFEIFTPSIGAPAGGVTALLVDHAGRLWIGTNQAGLTRVDEPGAARPAFTPIPGLRRLGVRSLVEDLSGRVYFGTGHGVGRIDPATGRITHFSAADGVPTSMVTTAFRDSTGALWFGTMRGISRLIPAADLPEEPPNVLLGALRIAGTPYPLAELGQRSIAGLVLQPDQRRLDIEVISPGAPISRGVRYQHRLVGSDTNWSTPLEERTFNFSLSPGTYRFEVRAITSGGVVSDAPAVVAFELLAPVWRRWWFMTIAAMATATLAYAAHRYRLRRALEVERVRTRIATDLHDDIGATLSQIAILSEVARAQLDPHTTAATPLQKIARLSGEAVDAMSDIVWALNPRRDRQVHLIQRMRRLASDLLGARNIRFHFVHPGGHDGVRLGTETRREVFLIFKEILNNIVRHAECSEVDIQLLVDGGHLRLEISDNGKGFDARGNDGYGNGLRNMRQRAEHLGGRLTFESAAERGTHIDVYVPVGSQH